MKVICISGKAQHGKDTTAGFLKEALERCGYSVLIAHYGDLLKYICRTFFDWNGEKDEYGRTLLQEIGTDYIRKNEPDYWVAFVESILRNFPDKWDFVLIPDCRFPNEIEFLRSKGYDVTHIRVVRPYFDSPLTEEQRKHPSETALDGYDADLYVFNDDTMAKLEDRICIMVSTNFLI